MYNTRVLESRYTNTTSLTSFPFVTIGSRLVLQVCKGPVALVQAVLGCRRTQLEAVKGLAAKVICLRRLLAILLFCIPVMESLAAIAGVLGSLRPWHQRPMLGYMSLLSAHLSFAHRVKDLCLFSCVRTAVGSGAVSKLEL